MSGGSILELVDAGRFRSLFIKRLGWNNPDREPLTVWAEGTTYKLDPAASYKGLRVWVCDQAPPRRVQRQIDAVVGKESQERLLIFCGDGYQDWRWPRRSQTGGINAKLMVHRYVVGERNQDLEQKLGAIEIDIKQPPTLVALLGRMREAFDVQIESESSKAAKLMGTLYGNLETVGVTGGQATLLLARLLFLLFGDDTTMWGQNRSDIFKAYIDRHTTDENLHTGLLEVFALANQAETERGIDDGHPLHRLPYINGGLFSEPLDLPQLGEGFRAALLGACDFDWSVISPAIFGSMFQTVKDKKARRKMGEHYTTETNILRTLRPLFLDELEDRLERAKHDKGQLTRLLDDLKALRVMDPACGCGNFLVVAYRELRSIELRALVHRRNLDMADGKVNSERGNLAQGVLDVSQYVCVTIDHFFGIEIEEWPARIAETAMLLVDHLANQQMEEEFGTAPHRLPIKLAPTIIHGNALREDWAAIVPPSDQVIIVGNPPFVGQYTKTATQKAEAQTVWGTRYNGYLDYVTCWYAKVIDYYGDHKARWGFVSTNSICTGEGAEYLWRPITANGWRCRFAHRSFRWATEAADGAAVHVSIIGFDRSATPKPVLWTYGEDGQGKQVRTDAAQINAYLIADAPMIYISSAGAPLGARLPTVTKGSQPTDDGNFFLDGESLATAQADPIARRFVRRFVGARELLHGINRWCLWLESATPEEIASSQLLASRVSAVKAFRSASAKAPTRKKAATAWLFDERRQPETSYLAIPRHVGENRRFFLAARFGPEVICGDANAMTPDPDGFVFAVLSSTMFIQWMRAVGGRIKSDLRFSNTFTYNSFPLPTLTERQRGALIEGARAIVDARTRYETRYEMSLADLYAAGREPRDVLVAHATVDAVIDDAFRVPEGASNDDRRRILLRRYAKLTNQSDPALF
ncbi:MAG: N-6 DNA methylase [Bifidobacteriaceae bacterium]|jgi:hypothetical protein|nr:N-6 DNA methylase [Bifidobacteriaceae bacterium]